MAEKTSPYTDQPDSRAPQSLASAAYTTDDCSSIEDDFTKASTTDQQAKSKKAGISLSETLSGWYKTFVKSIWAPRDPMYINKFELSDQGRLLMKLVFVGDMWVGKSSFLITASKGRFPGVYTPTVCDPYNTFMDLDIQGVPFQCRLWDTSSDEHFDRLRPLNYHKTDIFCICFSIGNPRTLERVWDIWAPEIFHFKKKNDPIFLLGFQSDLRSDPETIETLSKENKTPVTREQGEEMAQRIGAVGYLESSAIRYDNTQGTVDTMLEMVVEANPALKKRYSKKEEVRDEKTRSMK